MAERDQRPRGPDRRRQARGGRRPTDVWGYAPLVFVVDSRPSGRDACEAILAKLRFAVAPFDSVDQALKVVGALRPDLILASDALLDPLRAGIAPSRDRGIPVVAIPEPDPGSVSLLDAVRIALRIRPVNRVTI